MKYFLLWIIGVALVAVGAMLYAFAASYSNANLWIVATLFTILGGVQLFASYILFHSNPKKSAHRK